MPSMKRQVRVTMTVEFDADNLPSPDVDEALVDAVKNAQRMLVVLPPLKGRSTRGREVAFRIKALEAQS